ncbi:MAG TPA: hypothetical protein VE712_05295 [Actinomycetota bacterium]|nr:hypothetical protein [Actinomycetota bacterium]
MSVIRRLPVAAVVVASLVVLSPAAHARLALRDPNDTRGPLDVREVHHVGDRRPIWRIRTGPRWTARRLFDRGYLLVHLDTFGSRRGDYYALVLSNGRRMRGILFRDRLRPRRDRKLSSLGVWRRDRNSVSVRIPMRKVFVPKNSESYGWFVRTLWIKRRCPKSTCIDRAPFEGAVQQPLA